MEATVLGAAGATGNSAAEALAAAHFFYEVRLADINLERMKELVKEQEPSREPQGDL